MLRVTTLRQLAHFIVQCALLEPSVQALERPVVVPSYVPRGHSLLQVHQNVLLASTDLIPRQHHQAAHSVVLDTTPLPAPRVLSASSEHTLLQGHPPAPLALPDRIPGHHRQAAHSAVLGTTPLLAPRVLSVKLAALPLRRDLQSVRDVLLDLSLVLESLVVAYALPDC